MTDIDSIFDGADIFNQFIGAWHTSEIREIYVIFSGAKAFHQPP